MALTIIGVISGALLAGVFSFTDPLIKKNRRAELRKAVKKAVPGTVEIATVKRGGVVFYEGRDSSGRVTGRAFTDEFPGFQGFIKTMIGVDPDFDKVTGLVVLESLETPGLGSKITEPFFQDRFQGLNAGAPLRLVKNQQGDANKNEIESITGATISARAVVEAADERLSKAKAAWKQGR